MRSRNLITLANYEDIIHPRDPESRGSFWAFFHSALSPSIELGAVWPPKGVMALNPSVFINNSCFIAPTPVLFSHFNLIRFFSSNNVPSVTPTSSACHAEKHIDMCSPPPEVIRGNPVFIDGSIK